MKKPHTRLPGSSLSSSSSSSKLGIVQRGSHMIAKFKPKIKVIHIHAPQIIQTDAANFRNLVQRLTGKPEDNKNPPSKDLREKEEEEEEFLGLQIGKRIKNEDREGEIWRRSKSNERLSGFMDGFSELDGFMEELSTI